jgi:sugar lactone lactonase YvrE
MIGIMMIMAAVLVWTCHALASQAAQTSSAAPAKPDRAEIVRKLRAAHEAGDAKGFLEWSRALADIAPRSTRVLANLAGAYAMNGDAASAVALLDRLTKMEVSTEAATDHDFDPIRDTPAFKAALARAASLDAHVGSSAVAFRLDEPGLGIEGIAYDPTSRAFFLSSVPKRKIVRRTADGHVSDFSRSTDGLMSVVGLAVDAPRRRLWATSWGSPQMEGFTKEQENVSALVEYELDTGKLLRRIPPPTGLDRVLLSDLAVSASGDVFVADPFVGRIYVLRQGASALVVLTDTGSISSAQGLAPSSDGRFLFVADYSQGIVRVDQKTGAAVALSAPDDAAITGVDGLVLHGNELIGIQNGFEPHRVARFRLDPARERITAVDTLERRHPEFDEPTLGVLVGDEIYYVANSQAGRPKTGGAADTAGATDRSPAILRLRLDR